MLIGVWGKLESRNRAGTSEIREFSTRNEITESEARKPDSTLA